MEQEYCLYLRKSRADMEAEQRGDGETLARHEAALLELAGRQQLNVTQIHRELVSGETIAARPVMQQLLAQVEQGRWTGVLVMDIDRLARGDSVDQGVIAQAFKFSGTKIHTPMKTYDPGDEFDEEFFEFGLFMSRREYKLINRRLQRGREASVREGKYVGSSQPYGYRRVKLEGAKGYTLAPLEEQAAVVRTIFDWYVNGPEGVRIGVSAIANRLNSMGIPPPKKDSWSPSTVRDLLLNPVYTGKIRWSWRPVSKRMEQGRRVESRPRSKEYLTVEGLHPPIVEETLWEKAQKLSGENSVPKTKRDGGVKNPLSGLIVCGICGNRMVRKPYSTGARDSLLCVTPGCKNVSSTLEAVERQLLDSLSQWLRDYQVTVEHQPQAGTDAKRAVLEQLRTSLGEAEKQRSKAHDLLELGVYDVGTFLARTGELSRRLETLEQSLREMEGELELELRREQQRCSLPPGITQVLAHYQDAGTPARKNALLKEVLDKAVYIREKGGRWNDCGFELHIYPRLDGRL